MRTTFLLLVFIFVSVVSNGQVQTGKASFYADKFEGSPTASGEKYKHSRMTAAHKSLPFGTKVRVTNLSNSQSVEVVINDRGPYVDGRIIDLSKSAAEKLDFINQGITDVKVEVIDAGDGKQKNLPVTVEHVSVEEKEYYDFEVARKNPTGFGVQIGTYQELVNVIRLSDNLKSSYKKKVTIQVKVLNGVKFYSIVLGQFPTRKKAESFLSELKGRYPDAFILDYSRS